MKAEKRAGKQLNELPLAGGEENKIEIEISKRKVEKASVRISTENFD